MCVFFFFLYLMMNVMRSWCVGFRLFIVKFVKRERREGQVGGAALYGHFKRRRPLSFVCGRD